MALQNVVIEPNNLRSIDHGDRVTQSLDYSQDNKLFSDAKKSHVIIINNLLRKSSETKTLTAVF